MTTSKKEQIPIEKGLFTLPPPPEKPHLLGIRCKACGEVFFPKRATCSKCFSGEVEEIPLSRRGKVYSHTVVRHPPPEYEGTVPYGLGHVELPEGVLVITLFTQCDPEAVKIGMDMEMVLEKFKEDENGNEIVTYKFRPVRMGNEA